MKIHFLQSFTKKEPQNTIKIYINHPTTQKYSKITQKKNQPNKKTKTKPGLFSCAMFRGKNHFHQTYLKKRNP